MAKYDYVIKNGEIFDEEIRDFKTGDLGISGEKIKKIGVIDEHDGLNIIDAKGKVVAPGFIDLTSHSDTFWTIFSAPHQQSLLTQGVTTILGGNCGTSLAPLASPKNIQAIQKWTDVSGVNFNWQTVSEFLNEIEQYKLGVNFGTLVGHGTLRRNVIGDETRGAQKRELEEIKTMLSKSLDQGAFGISFNLAAAHEAGASPEEIIELCKIVSEKKGLVKHHLEDEGRNILPALVRLVNYARESKAKTQISHFKAVGRKAWEKFKDAVSLIENAREEGISLTADIFPYNRTGSSLYLLLPNWVRKNSKDFILNYLKNSEERKAVLEYLRGLTLHYEKIIVGATLRDKSVLGKTISEISEKSEVPPEEVILNLIETNDLSVSIFNEAIKRENTEEMLAKPYVSYATDGAGYDILRKNKNNIRYAHPRSFGTYPKVLKDFVREKKLLSLGEAIYKMSSLPAEILGLSDRGFLKEKMFADIVVFNAENVTDKSDFKNPFQLSEGMEWVFVSGEPAIENGEFKFSRNGRVLRRK